MIWLSRLVLDGRDRAVRRDLADVHDLHRTLMRAFPTVAVLEARAAVGFLYRLEPESATYRPVVLAQSAVQPDWTALPAGYLASELHDEAAQGKDIEPFLAGLRPGTTVRFRLRANATRRLATRPGGGDGPGPRVPLRQDEARLAWLSRRLGAAGAQLRLAPTSSGGVPDVRLVPGGTLLGKHPAQANGGGTTITIEAVLFEGRVEVTDPTALCHAVRVGIGPAKAYGCGLLTLAPG
jgi:CRISPR system Cascade subunit CasE